MKGGGHAHRVPDAGKGLPSVGGSVGDMSVLLRCGDMSICFIYLFFCLMSGKYITVLKCDLSLFLRYLVMGLAMIYLSNIVRCTCRVLFGQRSVRRVGK